MDWFFGVNWRSVLLPTVSLLEIILRGTLVYLALFALLRIVLKRETGELGVTDLLVLVLIADAAQGAMAGGHRSVPEGILLVATIIFWSYALDWLGYHFPRLQRLVRPSPLLLIKDGHMLPRNMRRELITVDELMSGLRRQGVSEISQVRRAYIEADGRISVITYDGGRHAEPERPAP